MKIRLSTLNNFFMNKNGKKFLIFTIIFSETESNFEFNIESTSINIEEFNNFIINIKNDKNASFKSINSNVESSFEIKYNSDGERLNIKNKFLTYQVKYSYEIYLIFEQIKNYLI
jgi:hypothetical protein